VFRYTPRAGGYASPALRGTTSPGAIKWFGRQNLDLKGKIDKQINVKCRSELHQSLLLNFSPWLAEKAKPLPGNPFFLQKTISQTIA
jgi:hypothetical protein